MLKLIESMNIKGKKKKPKKAKSMLGGSIIKEIDVMLKKQNGIHWKQSKGFAPSGRHECPRYLGYRLFGFNRESKFSARTYRIFDMGHLIHEKLCGYLDRLGILVETEREFWTVDPPLHGFIDAVILIGGEEVPVEIKSIGEYGFKRVKDLNSPQESHYAQLQFYLWALDLPIGIILYENKNNQMLLDFEVKRDDEFLDRELTLFRNVYALFKNGELHERPFEEDSKECGNCDAKKFCWADSKVGVPFPE